MSLGSLLSRIHSAASAPSRARKIVNRDDTIFATVRPTLRRIAQVQECLDGEIVSTAFCVLRSNAELMHPEFLFFAMQLESLMDEVAAMQTGASYPAVRDVDVMSLKVPVPPLSDQCSIADALNLARSAVLGQRRCEEATQALKLAAMQTLFTRGLQAEAQKETEIGAGAGELGDDDRRFCRYGEGRETHAEYGTSVRCTCRRTLSQPYIRVTDFPGSWSRRPCHRGRSQILCAHQVVITQSTNLISAICSFIQRRPGYMDRLGSCDHRPGRTSPAQILDGMRILIRAKAADGSPLNLTSAA